MRNNTYVQSLDRGLTILDVLSDGSPELGVTELALRLGVHKSRVFRLLSTLQGHDLVEQNSETEKYRLGYGLVRLSGAVVAARHLRAGVGNAGAGGGWVGAGDPLAGRKPA